MPRPALPTTLRARLWLSLAAMLVPLVLLGAMSIALQESSARRAAAVSARVLHETEKVSAMRDELLIAERAGEELLVTADPSAQRRFIDAGRAIENMIADLPDHHGRREQALIDAIVIDWRRAQRAVPEAAGGAAPIDRERRARFSWSMARAQDRVTALLEHSLWHLEHNQDAAGDQRRRQLGILAALLGLAAGIALVLSRRMHRTFAHPLVELQGAARALGAGDLSHRVAPGGADEVRAVGEAFNVMAERLVASRESLARHADQDPLTGLANRRVFVERTQAELDGGEPAVLFIDLDDFKTVNDSLGHAAGDALLVQVARRLVEAVRPRDLVARLGGDEFAVLLGGRTSAEEAGRIADRLRLALAAPVAVPGHLLQVRGSIGVATGADDAATLLRNADIAMYEAKAAGKDGRRTFEPAMHARAAARLELETALRDGLDNDAFELRYQPIVELATGHLRGVEALVRWRHPERGLVSPADFIPVAEASGLIVPLGAWVLARSCEFAAGVNRRAERPIRIGVNLSARQLEAPGLVEEVERCLADSGLDPQRLVLEITETTVARDLDATSDILGRLRGLGVKIAIDDFGTGYSSLGILRHLPFDVLKIDRAFVSEVAGEHDRDRTLIRAMVAVGEALGADVVAEGVEDREQVAALLELGCAVAQGFHFSRPLTGEDAERYALDACGLAWSAQEPVEALATPGGDPYSTTGS